MPKGRRRLPGFDDKVIAIYARGRRAIRGSKRDRRTGAFEPGAPLRYLDPLTAEHW